MLTDYIWDEEEDVVRVDQLRDHCGGGHRETPFHGTKLLYLIRCLTRLEECRFISIPDRT